MFEVEIGSSFTAMMFSVGCYAMVALAALGVLAFACIENYSSGKNDMADGLVLGEKQKNKAGYTSTKDKSDLLGAIAVCSTDLRPAGTVVVEGEPVDVVTEGDFVTKGDIVKVISTEGSRVVVRRI